MFFRNELLVFVLADEDELLADFAKQKSQTVNT